ncbi:hypothetical protein NW768_012066 [Fusarium equiseti]|uniref:Uncharacterized protein n=1 Tax=Fusarium equiseti TaxID=61235 RepID=A0ABQ8QVW3_FUSEQ|nr:hypothetical protein NW768_012066 [Fusarium equiseti]
MKFSTVLMPLMLLGDVVTAQSSLNDICAGSVNSDCTATITVPNGYKVITTRKKIETPNKCKNKKQVKYNCGTKSKPKTCTKLACVAGVDVTYKNVPTSIQINYAKVNVCEKVRQALGTTLGDNFLKARDPVCNCFTKLRTLNSEGKFTSSSAGVFDLANTQYLDQSETLQTCITKGGLKYGENKDVTLNKLKQTGWSVAPGAEMARGTFRAMIVVIHPCRVTGVCNSAQIYAVFSNYLTATYKTLLSPIVPVLNRWRDNLELIEKSTGYVVGATRDVTKAYNDIESTLNNYKRAICITFDYCGDNRPNIKKFLTNVDRVVILSLKLSSAAQDLSNVKINVARSPEEVNQLRANWAKVPTADEMVNRIKSNEIKVAKDVLRLMPVVEGMSSTANTVSTDLGPLKSFVSEYLAASKTLHELLVSMVAINWEKDFQREFGTDQYALYVRNGLISIQGNLNDALAEAAKTYFWLIRATDSQLKDFTLANGRWKMETGTAVYQRWSTIQLDMPCTKMTTTTYKKDGLSKTSNSYRAYWKCPFGPHDSQYPAVHVPYVRMYE